MWNQAYLSRGSNSLNSAFGVEIRFFILKLSGYLGVKLNHKTQDLRVCLSDFNFFDNNPEFRF